MQGFLHFTLFGFTCLLMLVNAAIQDGETDKSLKSKATEVEDKEMVVKREEVMIRSARSPGRNPRRKTEEKNETLKKKKKKSGKKTGARRQKQATSKKTDKKSKKKSKKGRNKGKKNGGQGRKKNQGGNARSFKKGKKPTKKGEKCPTLSRRTLGGRSGRAINETCLENILTVVKTYYLQVKNFEKQWKRIQSKNKTSVSKGGKMDVFKKPLERLVEAGGGDASNLSCQGSFSSPGAVQMNNLTSILTNCSVDIKESCKESSKPVINMTEVDKCNAMISEFEESVAGTAGCMKKTGESICDCFANQTLLDQAAMLRKCNLADESKAMATALKACKGSFGDCRKYKEEIIDIVSACSKTLDEQKEKAKNLAENNDNMKEAQAAVASVTGSGSRFGKDRSRREVPTDCAGFITVVELVITLVEKTPASKEVSIYCKKITAATVTCSEDEIASLKETEMEMQEAQEKLELAYEAVLEDILAQTGSTPTEEELESFVPETTAAATTTTTGSGTTTTTAEGTTTAAATTTEAATTAADNTTADTTSAGTTTDEGSTTATDATTTGDTTTDGTTTGGTTTDGTTMTGDTTTAGGTTTAGTTTAAATTTTA